MLNIFLPIQKNIKTKTFLVFNTACFGDNLVCNSLCQNIKRIYPDSKVIFIADKPFADVARHQQDVDDVVIYDKRGIHKGLKGFVNFLRDFKYKNAYASFITYRNVRNFWVSVLSGTKYTIKGKKLSMTTISAQEQILIQLKKITKEKLTNVPIRYNPEGSLSENLKSCFAEGKKYIAICTLTKKKSKDMPIKTAVDIIKNLSDDYEIIYTGVGDAGMEYAEQLKRAGCNFVNLVNKTSVNDLALVLKECKGLISVDTGTMHLGCSLDVPTIAVFYEKDSVKCWAPAQNLYRAKVIASDNSVEQICKTAKLFFGGANE